MSFLGMGPLEVLMVLLVAFVLLGPEKMVDAGRVLGKMTRELRRLSADLPALIADDDADGRGFQTRARRGGGAREAGGSVADDGEKAPATADLEGRGEGPVAPAAPAHGGEPPAAEGAEPPP